MALDLTNATSNDITVASAALDTMSAWTHWGWFFWDSALTNAWAAMFVKGSKQRLTFESTSTTIQASVVTSGVDGGFTVDADAELTADAWNFIVFSFSIAADAKMFVGNLTTLVAEVSYATGPNDATGTPDDDSADNFQFGNWENVNSRAWRGQIAMGGTINRVISLGEMKILQFRSLPALTNTLTFFIFGYAGGSGVTQPDWSGNGNSATVDGATVSDHVPLGPPFGFDAGFPFPAAGPTVPDQTLAPTQSQMNSGGMVGQMWMKRNRVYVPEELNGQ